MERSNTRTEAQEKVEQQKPSPGEINLRPKWVNLCLNLRERKSSLNSTPRVLLPVLLQPLRNTCTTEHANKNTILPPFSKNICRLNSAKKTNTCGWGISLRFQMANLIRNSWIRHYNNHWWPTFRVSATFWEEPSSREFFENSREMRVYYFFIAILSLKL